MNNDVTRFLEDLDHPLKKEIAQLRQIIGSAHTDLKENFKWNGPNYSFRGDDRITMRIHPPHQIQLIFHRGAKVLELPQEKLITDDSGLLTWKTNDRAVATFKSAEDIANKKSQLTGIVTAWLAAAH